MLGKCLFFSPCKLCSFHVLHHYSLEYILSALIIFVRHVHGFLEEIGQGVQHIASRVDNIISFVQEANDRRKIFGEVSSTSNENVSL